MANEELRKFLDSTTTALIPEDLEPQLVETVFKLAPAWTAMSQSKAEAKNHQFNQRTALPSASFQGENATQTSVQSTYLRNVITLKVIRLQGGVTNIAQLSMAKFIDAYKAEMVGAARAMGWQIEAGVLWGNSTADAYQFDGFDTSISTNVYDINGPISLQVLDDMIDNSDEHGGANHERMFVIGSKLRSTLARILRDRFHQIELTTVREGLTVPSYRGVPLMISTGVKAASVMSTVTATPAAGGSLSGTVYHTVAPITVDGEQEAAAVVSASYGGGNGTAGLSWTAFTGAFLYKIFRGTSATSTGQIAVIAAITYDGNGSPTGATTSYNDNGSLTPSTTRFPLGANQQVIFLIDRDPDDAAEVRYLSERDSIINYLELAQITDQKNFLLRAFMALINKYELVHGIARRVSPT